MQRQAPLRQPADGAKIGEKQCDTDIMDGWVKFSHIMKRLVYIDCSLIHVDSWPIVGTSSDEGIFWIKTSKGPFGPSFGELWVKNQHHGNWVNMAIRWKSRLRVYSPPGYQSFWPIVISIFLRAMQAEAAFSVSACLLEDACLGWKIQSQIPLQSATCSPPSHLARKQPSQNCPQPHPDPEKQSRQRHCRAALR